MRSEKWRHVHILFIYVLKTPPIQKLEGGVLHLQENGGDLLLLSALCPPSQHTSHVVPCTQGDHTHHTLEGEGEGGGDIHRGEL